MVRGLAALRATLPDQTGSGSVVVVALLGSVRSGRDGGAPVVIVAAVLRGRPTVIIVVVLPG